MEGIYHEAALVVHLVRLKEIGRRLGLDLHRKLRRKEQTLGASHVGVHLVHLLLLLEELGHLGCDLVLHHHIEELRLLLLILLGRESLLLHLR